MGLDADAPSSPTDALTSLHDDGPVRFAMVSPRLYRGGPPSHDDLVRLRALGVTRVIDLRRESLGKRRAEQAAAADLGLEYVEYPFYGVFGVEPAFLQALMTELEREDGGAIYLHCDNGRDRTSLAVALHRVVAEGWDSDRAWEQEAIAYGHRSTRMFREIELTFRDYVHEADRRRETARLGPQQRRALVEATTSPGRAGAVGP
jgi:hypothetical protein